MRYFTPMVLSLFLSISLYGQKIDFNAGMWSFVDNREYACQKTRAKTYLATQTWAEAGFRIDSLHRFMAGLNYMYEYGSHNPLQFGFPIAYYHFHHKSIDFYAGAFERKNKMKYPLALLSDTVAYFRPNIEGLLLSYNRNGFRQNVWIDWTSRQGYIHRETFLAGFSGQKEWESLYLNHYAILYHYARTLKPQPGEFLRDNAAININLGYNLSKIIFMDTLSFSIGLLSGIDRKREDGIWHTPTGLLTAMHAGYKFIGTEISYYHGPGLDVLMGDALYLNGNYGRADFYFSPFQKSNLKARLVFSWHYHQGDLRSNQQALSIDIRLNPQL